MSVKLNLPESYGMERETSIVARVVRVISVSMSVSEIDHLIDSFGRAEEELSPAQRAIQREFAQAVEQLR